MRQLGYDVDTAVGRTLIVQLDIVAVLSTVKVLSAAPTDAEIAQFLLGSAGAANATLANSTAPVTVNIPSVFSLLGALAGALGGNASALAPSAALLNLTLVPGQSLPIVISQPGGGAPLTLNLTIPTNVPGAGLAGGVLTVPSSTLLTTLLPLLRAQLVQQLPFTISAVIDDPNGKVCSSR